MNKVLFIIYYSKIANTGHHSCMFSVVYNNIQKVTNILIKKLIILISILNKYLDIPIYLDNRTPLTVAYLVVPYIMCRMFIYLFRMAGKHKRTGQGARSLHRIEQHLKAKKSSNHGEIVLSKSLESVEV